MKARYLEEPEKKKEKIGNEGIRPDIKTDRISPMNSH
jgi:hypothetical protein